MGKLLGVLLLSGLRLARLGVQHVARGVIPEVVAVLGVRVKLVDRVKLLRVYTAGHDVDPALCAAVREAAVRVAEDAGPARRVALRSVRLPTALLVRERPALPAVR